MPSIESNQIIVKQQRLKLERPLILLSFVALLYLSLMLGFISSSYLDFGDGNYLYISWRMTQGVTIYQDILSPQPPLHLLLGMNLLKLGSLLNEPLFVIRLFTILLRIGHGLLIYLVCQKIWRHSVQKKIVGAIAGSVYLFLPIGFWWSRGFQTEPVEIVWLLLTLLCFLSFDVKGMLGAGIFSALGILTNMTFAPYFCLNLFYLFIFGCGTIKRNTVHKSEIINLKSKIKSFRLFLAYLIPVAALLGFATLIMSWYVGGQFLQNVIFDQVGTYPKEDTIRYVLGKMKWIVGIILSLEGPLIATCLFGLYLFWRGSRTKIIPEKQMTNDEGRNLVLGTSYFVLVYMLAMLGSFIFATKGGTVDYIFTIGEPAVAIFSAFAVYWLIEKLSTRISKPISWVSGIMVLLLLSYPGIKQDIYTLQGTNYELNAKTVNQIVVNIQHYAEPNDLILAPPYFAFLAERKIVGEFSEQFVWFIKYYNYVRYQEGEPKTIEWIENIANLIATKQVKVIMLNIDPKRGQQTGQIFPIRKAVNNNYYPVGEIQMRNETLTVFLPK